MEGRGTFAKVPLPSKPPLSPKSFEKATSRE